MTQRINHRIENLEMHSSNQFEKLNRFKASINSDFKIVH
jgi:hypothetical protein